MTTTILAAAGSMVFQLCRGDVGEAQVKEIRSTTESVSSGINQERLITCIQNAEQDVERIQRCANRFGPEPAGTRPRRAKIRTGRLHRG